MMQKILKLIFILASIGSALYAKSVVSLQACEAFNNLKHTKNDGHVILEQARSYEVLQERRDNYYIRVPGANPSNRWVSSSCFNKSAKQSYLATQTAPQEVVQKNSKDNLDSVLVLSWHNSFCENHMNKKECKRDGGIGKNHLVLHGLWPQPRNNIYCNVDSRLINIDKQHRWSALPELHLTKEVRELMQKYMPASQSNLQRHEWVKHGTCYAEEPNSYFLNALTMAKRVDETIGEYLRANIGKRVKAINIQRLAARLIGKDIKYKIALKCKRGVLGEIWISLKGRGSHLGELVKNAKDIHSNCQEAIVDAPGRFRR